MGKKRSNSYIEEELNWLEERAHEIKATIESNPYNDITDRIVALEGVKGSTDKIAATAEQQQKAQRDAMKDYAQLLEAIDRSEEHTSELQSRGHLVCRLLL